jgi:hypothetical protein
VKTVGEIDSTGRIVRIFHRTATASWTHAPGELYRYRTRTKDQDGRNVMGWVEMRCECPVNESGLTRSDEYSAHSLPGTTPAGPARPQRTGRG